MKNLAICFSGAIRSFHLCHESIKKMIIDPLQEEYNVYIFGHFWTIKQEEHLEDLSYRMKWKKESDCVYDLIKNFGFTQYVIEEYNSDREKEIMDNLGNLHMPISQSLSNSAIEAVPISNLQKAKAVIPQYNTVSMARQATIKVVKDVKEHKKTILSDVKENLSKTILSDVKDAKNLANKILESYKLIEDPEKRSQYLNYAVNSMGMYYKILMSNRLKNEWAQTHNLKFDYTIRMRPDFLWNDPIPHGIFEKITDKNIVLVYDNYCTRAKWQGNDKFFGGTDTMMNEYCDMYNQFEYFFDKGIRIEGQELSQGMVKKMELKIVFFGTENTYDKVAGPLYRRLERELAQRNKKTKSEI